MKRNLIAAVLVIASGGLAWHAFAYKVGEDAVYDACISRCVALWDICYEDKIDKARTESAKAIAEAYCRERDGQCYRRCSEEKKERDEEQK